MAAACEISVQGGNKVKVHRIVAATDCGYAVNPAQIERQVSGSFVYGLSALFMQECTVKGGRIVEHEFLQIREVNGKLAYVAKPSGQAEATFAIKTISDGEVVFENPAHDFPQRILYRRTPDGVTARVEGTRNGQTRGSDFVYTRCR